MFERAANTNDGQFGVTRRGVSESVRREGVNMHGLGGCEWSFRIRLYHFGDVRVKRVIDRHVTRPPRSIRRPERTLASSARLRPPNRAERLSAHRLSLTPRAFSLPVAVG